MHLPAIYPVIGLICLLTINCDVKNLFKDKTVTDKENRFQISVPFLWKEANDLHDTAEIQVAYAKNGLYCIILAEAKTDFDEMDLASYTDITCGSILENLKNSEQSKLNDIEINGLKARQCTISGVMDNLNLVYIHTAVEAENYFIQIIGWTLKSNFKKYQKELENVISSFKVIEEEQDDNDKAQGMEETKNS